MTTPLQKAIDLAGGQSALARILSTEKKPVSQQNVNYWLANPSFLLSPEHCVKIDIFTEGKVSRKDLHPDDWKRIWPELEAA